MSLTCSMPAMAFPRPSAEKVFAPFYRLGGDRPGAGLGLSLVRQIARLHGGDAGSGATLTSD